MNFKDVLRNNPFTIAIIVVAALISGITFAYSKTLALIQLFIILGLVIAALKWISYTAERKKDFLRAVESSITESGENGKFTGNMPFPLLLVRKNGSIEWFNKAFNELIDDFDVSYTDNAFALLPDIKSVLSSEKSDCFEISTKSKEYTVFPSFVSEDLIALYFVDDSELKGIRTAYNLTRPAVLLINIDSLEHTEDVLDHADYYSVVSDVERIITKWLAENKCVFRKFADGKFMALTETKNLDVMISHNFDILDKIRNYRYAEQEMDITLSIGIGRDKQFSECEVNARQALDMARGRGGDQVAVKIDENYEFFGGLTSRKEKRGKIRSRIISVALNEYIEKCNSVFIMGHKFSDFDAIGAAVGIAALVKGHSKNAFIVVNEKQTLAAPLIELLRNEKTDINFISPQKAESIIGNESLVVVVDTMRSQLVESGVLLDKAKNIILIDHHRKSVDYINDASLAFHEPYASSACEMVTELIQYSPSQIKLSQYEAEALLSGIILDTKNFTLRVGVRTFEAAAYLKDRKADTVVVRKLFFGTVDENISVSKLISAASYYDRYAVAVAENENISRLISSKTADELLTITGVDASFVVSKCDDTVYISARSLGAINVQLIMEQFGGGGHQSMAACQRKNISIKDAVDELNDAVRKYIEKT